VAGLTDRRGFIRNVAFAAGAAPGTRPAHALRAREMTQAGAIARVAVAPVLRKELWRGPIPIASVELLKQGNDFLVRVRSKDGAVGLAVGHPGVLETTWPILTRRVAPYFVGKDARSIRVARMAAAAGLPCTPHMSGCGLGYLYVAHFASCVPNAGPFQEFKGTGESLPVSSETSTLTSVGGMLKVPSGPGLGVTVDPAFVASATSVF
jgi:hypothetical protein